MPRTKRPPSLARLFDECGDPIYVIDAGRRIVYANQALLDWTGQSREDLVGQVVAYHTDAERAAPTSTA